MKKKNLRKSRGKFLKNGIAAIVLTGMISGSLPLSAMTTNKGTSEVKTDLTFSVNDKNNVLRNLSDKQMWSNNNGKSWTRGKATEIFLGAQTIQLMTYDQEIFDSSIWQAKDYAGGSVTRHNGALYKAQYWADAKQEPGKHDLWLKLRDLPQLLGTYQFTAYTDEEADAFQRQAADKVFNAKKVVAYFANWQGYKADYEPNKPDYSPYNGNIDGKGYDPVDVPFDKITHVNYGFILVDKETGKLKSNDPWADFSDAVPGGGKDYIGQITRLADKNNVTAMVSIGGWDNSIEGAFDTVTKTPEAMNKFTDELVKFMLDNNFDGIDIDWEYPDTPVKQERFLRLMKQLREKITIAGKKNDRYYQLSAAVTAAYAKMPFIDPTNVAPYLDTFNVMSYDFHGAWENKTGHHSALYPSKKSVDPKLTVDGAMNEYANVYNVPKQKLLVGLGYYSKGWKEVAKNGIGAAGNGAALGGTWDDPAQPSGLRPHWQMKKAEAEANANGHDNLTASWDEDAKVPYMYDGNKKEFFTYDNAKSIQHKVDYTKAKGFGGAIIWELAYDTADTAELGTIAAQILDSKEVKPVLTGKPDQEYPVGTSITEDRFFLDINVKMNLPGKIRSNFITGINFSKPGTYTVAVVGTTEAGVESNTHIVKVVVKGNEKNFALTAKNTKDYDLLNSVSEKQFLTDIAATINKPGTITSDFSSKVDFNKIGEYTVKVVAKESQGTNTQSLDVKVNINVPGNRMEILGISDVMNGYIHVDETTDNLLLSQARTKSIHSYLGEKTYFGIEVQDNKGTVKKSASIKGKETVAELNKRLGAIKLNEGDILKISGPEVGGRLKRYINNTIQPKTNQRERSFIYKNKKLVEQTQENRMEILGISDVMNGYIHVDESTDNLLLSQVRDEAIHYYLGEKTYFGIEVQDNKGTVKKGASIKGKETVAELNKRLGAIKLNEGDILKISGPEVGGRFKQYINNTVQPKTNQRERSFIYKNKKLVEQIQENRMEILGISDVMNGYMHVDQSTDNLLLSQVRDEAIHYYLGEKTYFGIEIQDNKGTVKKSASIKGKETVAALSKRLGAIKLNEGDIIKISGLELNNRFKRYINNELQSRGAKLEQTYVYNNKQLIEKK
ncbi:MAG: glycosyl hydrolase family 18 protein [Culicoidibacterales bacterium]